MNKEEIIRPEMILNVAAGNQNVINDLNYKFDDYFMISNDTSYYCSNDPDEIENMAIEWSKNKNEKIHVMLQNDIFEYLSKTRIIFDRICVYRFLEHVDRVDVLYFIYLLARVLESGGILDVIVPNYRTLAQRILDEDVYDKDFEKNDILTTTEVLNESNDPHCSIWTVDRIKRFFELEERFTIENIDESYNFDGRNIYIRAILRRV